MVTKGYPAHVGTDFMTSLIKKVKADDNLFISSKNIVNCTRYNEDDDESSIGTHPYH